MLMAQAAILKDLITALDLETAYQLEQEIKVSNSRISKAINRNSRITGDIILAITARYPDVSRQWLETGSGDMFIPTPHAGYTGTDVPNNQHQEPGAIYQMNVQEAREAARAAAQLRGRLNTKSSFEDVINAVNDILDRLDKMEGKGKA